MFGIRKRHTHQNVQCENSQLDTGTVKGLLCTLTPTFQHQLNFMGQLSE